MIEAVAPGIGVLPLRTPTLPPATHTNAWILGEGRLTVVDPASPWEDERDRLWSALAARQAAGEGIERVVLTHHHHDHVAGAAWLAARAGVPVYAHAQTAALVADQVRVDVLISDGDALVCGAQAFQVVHTPGHAPGHVVLHDRASGAIVAGDMVAGVGTIVIDPRDGDLAAYLASLERMIALGGQSLLPAHGPVLEHPEQILGFYIAHRHQRSEQIREALGRLGRATAMEVAEVVYAGQIPASALPIAAVQVTSHLRWLAGVGLVSEVDGGWVVAR